MGVNEDRSAEMFERAESRDHRGSRSVGPAAISTKLDVGDKVQLESSMSNKFTPAGGKSKPMPDWLA